jgi:hypothetical protein
MLRIQEEISDRSSSLNVFDDGAGGPPIEASSIDRTQQSRFHLMTREEPSLETWWLQNIRMMDKVQIKDRSDRRLEKIDKIKENGNACSTH